MRARVFKAGARWYAGVPDPDGFTSRKRLYVVRSFATWAEAIDFALYPWA